MQVAHPHCGEPSRLGNTALQTIKRATGFVLTIVAISTSACLETLYKPRRRAKPGPVGKEKSWAVCKGMYEDDEREELGSRKEGKEKSEVHLRV